MKTFVAAVEAGSFTAAADRLGLSKKLVSKYVGELEDRLGARLLQRTTRRHSLTEAGQQYYGRCLEILEAIDAAEADISQQTKGLTGTIRLAAPVTFGEAYLPPLLSHFRSQHPELVIDLRLSDRYIDLAETGVDLALRIGSLGDSAIIARRVTQTDLWTVAAPAYVAARGQPKTPVDLGEHCCIHDSNLRSGLAWEFTDGVETQRVPIQAAFLVDSARVTSALTLSGEGVARCPDYIVADHVAAGRLVRLLQEYTPPPLDIQVLYLRSAYMPKRVRALVDFLVSGFATRPW